MNNIKPLPRVPATNGKVNVKVIKADDIQRERDRRDSININMMRLLIDDYTGKAVEYLRESGKL